MTDDEKKLLTSLERRVLQLANKIPKKAAVVVPPQIFGCYVQNLSIGDLLWTNIFPADCQLRRFTVFLEELARDKLAKICVEIKGEKSRREFDLTIPRGLSVSTDSYFIAAGEIVTVRFIEGSEAKNLWISCLCDVDVDETTKEYFLVEELLAELET